ncbi:FAD-dependent oxidoreductase [Raoultibacter timonensis]|uniref:oxidoreductase n=1 Tax=Raoultibacter timonensis TaxID=1907662 RepID=UPI0026DC1D1F|nr:FAD-dependent oxidoreductase [Raoultibacter timonensis]
MQSLKEERNREGMSRRSFLGLGTAAAVGTFAMAGLGGCAPASQTANSNAGSSAKAEPVETYFATAVNPQDDSYTAYTTDYSNLFSPFKIGPYEVKNRIVKSGATSRTVITGPELSQSFKDYYGQIAEGGTGFIWIDQFFDFTGKAQTGNTPLATDEDAAKVKEFTDYVHSQGAFIGGQIWGLWSQSSCDGAITAPYENTLATRVMLSTEEVHAFQQTMINRCIMLKKAGFDGVDINAGCDHTFATFLSRHWNTQRDDEYGPQSFENRARILTELIAGIKEACGKDFVVQVLYNGIEENVERLGESDDCMTVEEAAIFAKLFEEAGADSLQIRLCTIGYHAASFFTDVFHVCEPGNTGYGTQLNYDRHLGGKVIGKYDGACALLDVAAEIKKAVSIPVGTVGVMDPRLAPDLIDNALGEGKIDFVAMTRPLMCDPDLPVKLQEGRRDEVAPCNHCLTCLQAVLPHPVTVGCRCNAVFGRVRDGEIDYSGRPEPAEDKKRVMVIGGGPSGMEAARIAASRGHEVTLYESSSSLNGLMTFASAVKGPHEKIADFCSYLQRQLEVTGVTVVTGKTVDKEFIQSENPDAVIVATGGVRPSVTIKGAEESGIMFDVKEAATSQELGESIIVLGDNHHAIDFAINMVKQGKAVTIVSPRTEEFFDVEHPSWVRYSMKAWLESKGTRIYYEAAPIEMTETGLTISTSFGTEVAVEGTAVVNCAMLEGDSSLYDDAASITEAYMVGDCAVPSTIAEAVSSGNKVARTV